MTGFWPPVPWTLMTLQGGPPPDGRTWRSIGVIELEWADFPRTGRKVEHDGIAYVVDAVVDYNGSNYDLRLVPDLHGPVCTHPTVMSTGYGDEDATTDLCGRFAVGLVVRKSVLTGRSPVEEFRCEQHIVSDREQLTPFADWPEGVFGHPLSYWRDIALKQAEHIREQAERAQELIAARNKASDGMDALSVLCAEYARRGGFAAEHESVVAAELHEQRLLVHYDRRNHFLEGVHWELLKIEQQLREEFAGKGLSPEQRADLSMVLTGLLDYRKRDRELGKPGPRERSGTTAMFYPPRTE